MVHREPWSKLCAALGTSRGFADNRIAAMRPLRRDPGLTPAALYSPTSPATHGSSKLSAMLRAAHWAPQRIVARLLLLAALVLVMPEPVAVRDDHRCAGTACIAPSDASSPMSASARWHSEDVGGGDALHDSHANAHVGIETAREAAGVSGPTSWQSYEADRLPSSVLVGGIFRPPQFI